MRTGTPIGKNYVTLCIERIFAEEPRQVDHKYAILRNQQQFTSSINTKHIVYLGTIYNFRHHLKSKNSYFTGFPHNTHLFLTMCSM